MPGRFIGGVSAVVYHPPTATYLLLRRADDRDFGAGDWETVTGRVEHGETFEQALRREVREEIGAEIQIDFIIGTTHFFRGPALPENELLGLRFACTIADRDSLALNDEHSEHRWVRADALDSVLAAGHRLRTVIARAETLREALPTALVERQRVEGFEVG